MRKRVHPILTQWRSWHLKYRALATASETVTVVSLLALMLQTGRFRQMTEMRRWRGTLCPEKRDSSSLRISWVNLYLAWSLEGCMKTMSSVIHHTSTMCEMPGVISSVSEYECRFKISLAFKITRIWIHGPVFTHEEENLLYVEFKSNVNNLQVMELNWN